jgi:hypothetical protein
MPAIGEEQAERLACPALLPMDHSEVLFKYRVVLPEPIGFGTARLAGKDKQYGIPDIRASGEYPLLVSPSTIFSAQLPAFPGSVPRSEDMSPPLNRVLYEPSRCAPPLAEANETLCRAFGPSPLTGA